MRHGRGRDTRRRRAAGCLHAGPLRARWAGALAVLMVTLGTSTSRGVEFQAVTPDGAAPAESQEETPLQAEPDGQVVDRVVVAIDGDPVTYYDLGRWTKQRGVEGAPTREMLEAYVTEQLVLKEAKLLGIKVPEEAVDRYIAQIKAQRGMTDAQFDRALREEGIDKSNYREEVRAEIQKSELINREVRGRVSVSPEAIRRQYDEHKDEYTMAERVRLRMILIPVGQDTPPETAAKIDAFVQELFIQLQQGADFAELAQKYSAGPGRSEGGDLGWFERGQMVDTLEQVAFRLPAGSISTPLRSSAGYQILKIEEREGSVEQPFDAVEEQIRQQLYQEAMEERYDEWLRNGLREGHHVEILW